MKLSDIQNIISVWYECDDIVIKPLLAQCIVEIVSPVPKFKMCNDDNLSKAAYVLKLKIENGTFDKTDKIGMIKFIREHSNLMLKEAKDFVEANFF